MILSATERPAEVAGPRQPHPRPRTNVGTIERLASGVVGCALAVHGIRQRSLGGLFEAAIGGVLIDRGLRGHSRLYDSLHLDTAGAEPARPEEYFEHGIHVQESVTINKRADELYRFWRDLTNLPQIMRHLDSVTPIDDKRSHWVAKGPVGIAISWDAEIINDEPNQTIAWRSLAGAIVPNSGSVRFVPAPGDRGTEVHVTLDYIPPAGRLAVLVAKLFGEEPGQQVREDLRRFKQIMEAGEAPTTEGQPMGAAT